MNATDQGVDPPLAAAIAASEGLPLDEDNGVVFEAPWQAAAFAMTLALHEKGLFTWDEWARTLGARIRDARACGDPDRGDTYYLHWLAALETLCETKQLTDAVTVRKYQAAWARATHRTPHGSPIELQPDDFQL